MKRFSNNYSSDPRSEENRHFSDKYAADGESEFSQETSHPLDEVLSERHFHLGGLNLNNNRDRFADNRPLKFTPAPVSHRGKGPKGYRRSDQRIHEDVCEFLFQSYEVDASEIEVFVTDGEVRLTGLVDSRATKKKAEELIEHLPGVIDVRNELRIQNDFPEKRSTTKGLVQNHTPVP